MKIVPLILALVAAALLAGCATAPSSAAVVIEAGAPSPGDADYARARALRINRERTAVTTGLDTRTEAPTR